MGNHGGCVREEGAAQVVSGNGETMNPVPLRGCVYSSYTGSIA
jgi:hypothetical protein